MKRLFALLFLLALISIACSSEPEPAATSPPAPETVTEATGTQESTDEQPGIAPTDTAPMDAATETPSEPTSTPVAETTEETVVEPTVTPAPTAGEGVVFNGPYENTYFRGSAAAPVTMIDYSDFL